MRIEYCREILKEIESGYRISPRAFKIGEAALLGMLYEVSTSPSPGLVSPNSSGAHGDMNYFTFLKSTSSIAYSMYLCAQIGMDYDEGILKRIRSVGLYAERSMLAATEGVNTQRGLLFLAGAACAAAGSCARKNKSLNRTNVSEECKFISKGIVNRELKKINDSEKLTNGERLYREYGITGIRGEIENGLPSIINIGLPLFEEALGLGFSENDSLSHSLIGLMTAVEDTTVVNRCGLKGLELMRDEARKALAVGGMKTEEGREYIKHMEELFKEKNISPGGAADLLAVTFMIYKLEKDMGKGDWYEKPAGNNN